MKQQVKEEKLILSQAPHIHSGQSLNIIMWVVFISLLPAAINAYFVFGKKSVYIMLLSVLSAVLSETIFRFFLKRPFTALNGSAAVTGLLVAMNVPPEASLWIAPVGSAFAIIIVKEMFGGIGFNIFNPALAARAFLMASWPTEMTAKWHVFSNGKVLTSDFVYKAIDTLSGASPSNSFYDAVTGATPLTALKGVSHYASDYNIAASKIYEQLFTPEMFKSLALGNIGGCIGETSAIFLLFGAVILLLFKIIRWEIPVAYIGSFSAVILLHYFLTGFPFPFQGLLYHILSGGLILGAFFMATDMVTSPATSKGMITFGIGCGIIASIIRLFGGYPEGVSYSILLMNATVPLIDRYMKPKMFGKLK